MLDDTFSETVRSEASALLNGSLASEIKDRLFQLYLQREDMASFLHDFTDFEKSLGLIDTTEKLNWSQYRVTNPGDIVDLELFEKMNKTKSIPRNDKSNNLVDSENVPNSYEFSELNLSALEEPELLKDREGRIWSGIILDTDSVQKPMPGNRVASSRVLVVIGNMNGTAGFGVGKSNNVSDATKAAFR